MGFPLALPQSGDGTILNKKTPPATSACNLTCPRNESSSVSALAGVVCVADVTGFLPIENRTPVNVATITTVNDAPKTPKMLRGIECNPSDADVAPTLNHSNPVNKCARKYSANVQADAKTKANHTGW